MSIINYANTISLSRVFLLPFFIITVLKGHRFLPLLLFTILSLTDAIDGYVAKRYGSNYLGKYLDPICDKLFLISSYITLTILNFTPLWFLLLIFIRDIVLAIGFLVLYLIKKKPELKITMLGKASTFMQMLTIIIVLVSRYFFVPKIIYLFYLTSCLILISAIEYSIKSIISLKKS